MGNFIDLTGKRFGRLTVLYKDGKIGVEHAWLCLCDCGNTIRSQGVSLRSGNIMSCKCTRRSSGKTHKRWKGYEEISSKFWSDIKCAASKRDIDFNLTIEEGWDLFLKQERKCSFTGRILTFPPNSIERGTASLDRKDCNFGYYLENVQWVHKDINRIKWTLNNKEFISICQEIVIYAEKRT
jgi:hypothetical protein